MAVETLPIGRWVGRWVGLSMDLSVVVVNANLWEKMQRRRTFNRGGGSVRLMDVEG